LGESISQPSADPAVEFAREFERRFWIEEGQVRTLQEENELLYGKLSERA